MPWTVRSHDAFDAEYDAMPDAVQDELLAATGLLELYGPGLAVRMPIRLADRSIRT